MTTDYGTNGCAARNSDSTRPRPTPRTTQKTALHASVRSADVTTTTANLERHTVAIVEWIRRGEIEAARSAFNYADRDADSVEDLVKALGAATTVPAGIVRYGPARVIWGNPYRAGYAWRCGDCRWTGSYYRHEHEARAAAAPHSTHHPNSILERS